jgi:TIR domain
MPTMKIPTPVIYAVGDVLGNWYYSHTKINTLFRENGAPGEPPEGNCVTKCQTWLRRANDDPAIDPLDLLGRILVEFMSLDREEDSIWQKGVDRINRALAVSRLSFRADGTIVSKESRQRFKIALSFPGEHRPFVEQVAVKLANEVGRDQVLYDKYYEAEFARPDLDIYLQQLYHDESELIAMFLCADYERREWCGLEWRAIRDLIKKRQASAVMPLRFDNTEIPGLFSTDGYAWIGNRSPQDVANLILQRMQFSAPEAAAPTSTASSTSGAPTPAQSARPAPRSSALVLWQKKLAFFQVEEAKAVDAAHKFKLLQDIEEAKAKIREHGGQA